MKYIKQHQILLIQECFDLQSLRTVVERSQNFSEVAVPSNPPAINASSAALPVLNSPEYFDYDDSVFTTLLNDNSSSRAEVMVELQLPKQRSNQSMVPLKPEIYRLADLSLASDRPPISIYYEIRRFSF